MKKPLIALAVLLGVVIFTYGSLAALVNQGVGLSMAITIFFLVLVGGAGLVYLMKDPPENRVDADPDENSEKGDSRD